MNARQPASDCPMCDGRGAKDHAWLAVDPCECTEKPMSLPPLQDERVRDALRTLTEVIKDNRASIMAPGSGWTRSQQRDLTEALHKANAALSEERPQVSDAPAQADAASLPLPAKLLAMRERVAEARSVFINATGIAAHSALDALCDSEAEFHDCLVNWFDTLTATKPSGQVERERIVAWLRDQADEGVYGMADSEKPRDVASWLAWCIEDGKHLTALSTQVQTVGGE